MPTVSARWMKYMLHERAMACVMSDGPVHVAAAEEAPAEDDVALALLGLPRVDHAVLEGRERAEGLHMVEPGWKAPLIVLSSIGRSGSA